MKKILFFIFALIIVAAGCQTSDEQSLQDLREQSLLTNRTANNYVQQVIQALSITIDEAIANPNLTEQQLGEKFLSETSKLNVPTITLEDPKNVSFSDDYKLISQMIYSSSEYETPQEYINFLDDIDNNLEVYDIDANEKILVQDQIYFLQQLVVMLEAKDNVYKVKGGCNKGWWKCWGKCVAGIVGGTMTGGVVGCGAVGAVGAAIGLAWGPQAAAGGGLAGCAMGGIVGAIGGGLTGAAAYCD